MEAALYLTGLYAVLLLPWAVLASPVIIGFVLALRFARRRHIRPVVVSVPLAAAFTLLAAPVPTPIITVLIPHGVALLGGRYYFNILHGPEMMVQLWWWIVPSLVITFGLSLGVAWRYGRPPNNSSKPTPLRGAA